ncbi:hypothetical protein [Terrisporobacter sp.]|uniref:hypothetical protein n=1 Tax=Terrisporobacter sp. TaxID=1965305 RepID=UPI0026133AB9|nr:hypothetical protein [Terrisporobacter sp.]
MENLWGIIIATVLSSATFSFLFYILNYRICGIFEPIQRDLEKLSNTSRRILSFAGYVLVILITAFLKVSLGISSLICGLILGFLGTIIDTCFRNNIIEIITKKNNEQYY